MADNDRHDENYIMDKAENKFRILEREGTWQVKEREKDKFLALEAKCNRMLKQNKRLLEKQNKRKRSDWRKTPKDPKKGKTKVDIYRRPKSDIKKPVIINGTKWWWCGIETGGKCIPPALRKHKPADCKGKTWLTQVKKEKEAKLQAKEAEIAPAASSESEE